MQNALNVPEKATIKGYIYIYIYILKKVIPCSQFQLNQRSKGKKTSSSLHL